MFEKEEKKIRVFAMQRLFFKWCNENNMPLDIDSYHIFIEWTESEFGYAQVEEEILTIYKTEILR